MLRLLCIASIFPLIAIAAPHTIVFLICPPRSASTACVRSWENRGDFTILHEISMRAFDADRKCPTNFLDRIYRSDAPADYQEVIELIMSTAQESNVFVKEISYSAIRLFNYYPELLADPRVFCIFLVRDPYDALVSFFKKRQHMPMDLHCDFGYRTCYELFERVKYEGAHPPLIIFAEDLHEHGQEIWQTVCNHLGIPFTKNHLEWPQKELSCVSFKNWHEIKKYKEFVYHWHDAALKSTHFTPMTHYKKSFDEQGLPVFEQINYVQLRPLYQAVYSTSMPYYQLLKNEQDYHVLSTLPS